MDKSSEFKNCEQNKVKPSEVQSTDSGSIVDLPNFIVGSLRSNSTNEPYSDAPLFLRNFLIYIDTIKGRSKRTADAYYTDLRTFLRYFKVKKRLVDEPIGFGSTEPAKAISALGTVSINDVKLDLIADISLEDLYEYMAYLNRTRQNNQYTRARRVSSIRALYKYLTVKTQELTTNPAKDLESPKLGKSLPRYLSLDDSLALLNAIPKDDKNYKRDYLILTLFLNCGLRLSELVGTNIGDIRGDTLRVIGKGNKERVIHLNNACQKALENHLEERKTDNNRDNNALILNRSHRRLGARTVQNMVDKYLKLAGLDFEKYSPHKLRHTAATLMYQNDVDIRELQEILGHEQLSTTEIYTHLDKDSLRTAVSKNPLADL